MIEIFRRKTTADSAQEFLNNWNVSKNGPYKVKVAEMSEEEEIEKDLTKTYTRRKFAKSAAFAGIIFLLTAGPQAINKGAGSFANAAGKVDDVSPKQVKNSIKNAEKVTRRELVKIILPSYRQNYFFDILFGTN